ncbi:MAG: hypothetical protein VX293_10940 [Candidatus Latescibacterota bacterium]|nr:hypothetical protein [Candidatus Latescibacterota bacterium]
MEKSTADSTDNARLCAALDTISTNSIPSVALGLGLLYLLLAVSHMMVLPPPLQTPMTAAAGISAALLLTLRLVLGHYPMPAHYGHLLAIADEMASISPPNSICADPPPSACNWSMAS